jgi:hypothetical protein
LGPLCVCPSSTGLHVLIRYFPNPHEKIFYDFEDFIVYIDNFILSAKILFQNHIQRLALVLKRIEPQNLHVHIEETFLATNQVDFLGYSQSSKGINSRNQKILAVLALADPRNKIQFRIFLDFVVSPIPNHLTSECYH